MGVTLGRRDFLLSVSTLAAAAAVKGCALTVPSQSRPACILIALEGGPGQMDTFDPKDNGLFAARATSLEGLTLSEHFPALAEHAKDLTFLRGVTGLYADHQLARAHLESGLRELDVERTVNVDALEPANVDPHATEADVFADYRNRLHGALEAIEQGERRFARATLSGWDTHLDAFERTRVLSRALDRALDEFFTSAAWRRLRETTVVVISGEFGRCSVKNAFGGRAHHAGCWTAMVAGAAFRPGLVLGVTDARGERVLSNPIRMTELHATVRAALGVSSGNLPAVRSLLQA